MQILLHVRIVTCIFIIEHIAWFYKNKTPLYREVLEYVGMHIIFYF